MTMTSMVTEAECRTLPQLGCDGQLRLARRWQRAQRQSTGGSSATCAGGGFCDCEVVFNVFGVDPAGDGPACD